MSIMSSPSPMDQFCVGTLVASKYVLTSGQCVHGKSPSSIYLMIGDQDLAEFKETVGETELHVSRVLVHDSFQPINKIKDIALLELTEEVDLTVHTPACLPAEGEVTGDQAQVTGWDDTTFKLSTVAAHIVNYCTGEVISAAAINSSLPSGACQVTI